LLFLSVTTKLFLTLKQANLAGTYTSSSLNTTITLATEPGLPALKVTSFVSNSSDVLTVLMPVANHVKTADMRLYPTLIVRKTKEGNEVRKYHAVVNDPERIYPSDQVWATNCVSWDMLDSAAWGALGIDEFWIETDREGRAVNVQPKAFGVTLEKKEPALARCISDVLDSKVACS
jgi:hypothetical protein